MDVEIEPLTPELWPQLAALFEEGGDPRWCWCMYWRRRGLDWSNADREGNRAALEALAGREVAPGLVALDPDGRAVGWVSLAPRDEFDRLARSRSRPRCGGLQRSPRGPSQSRAARPGPSRRANLRLQPRDVR